MAISPTSSSFPIELEPVFYIATSEIQKIPKAPSNLILFLPGQGDNASNFSNFARNLNLPDSLSITVSPPFPLPDLLGVPNGRSWCRPEDLQIDSTTGDLGVSDGALEEAVKLIAMSVVQQLIQANGWAAKRIHLVGSGIGGSVALLVGLKVSALLGDTSDSTQGVDLGGIMSLGGVLPVGTSMRAANGIAAKKRTPIVVIGGSEGQIHGGGLAESSAVKRIKDHFEHSEFVKWKRKTDGMPANRDEVLPMMKFWGRTLASRRGIPVGAVEVGRA